MRVFVYNDFVLLRNPYNVWTIKTTLQINFAPYRSERMKKTFSFVISRTQTTNQQFWRFQKRESKNFSRKFASHSTKKQLCVQFPLGAMSSRSRHIIGAVWISSRLILGFFLFFFFFLLWEIFRRHREARFFLYWNDTTTSQRNRSLTICTSCLIFGAIKVRLAYIVQNMRHNTFDLSWTLECTNHSRTRQKTRFTHIMETLTHTGEPGIEMSDPIQNPILARCTFIFSRWNRSEIQWIFQETRITQNARSLIDNKNKYAFANQDQRDQALCIPSGTVQPSWLTRRAIRKQDLWPHYEKGTKGKDQTVSRRSSRDIRRILPRSCFHIRSRDRMNLLFNHLLWHHKKTSAMHRITHKTYLLDL